MKKKKLFALVLSAGVVFSLAACGGTSEEPTPDTDGETQETWTDQDIVDNVMNSSALVTDNAGSPIYSVTDKGESYLNEIASQSGGYVVVADSYNIISDVGNPYTVNLSWEIKSSELDNFVSFTKDGTSERLTANWGLTDANDSVKVVLEGKATYNNSTATRTYNLTFLDNQQIIAIEDMENNTEVTTQGYVTAFIEGGLYNNKEEWYQVMIQSGDYAFAVFQPYKDVFEGISVGDALTVSGTTSFYNGQRQIKNSGVVITKLSSAEASTLAQPNTITMETVDDFDSNKLLSKASLSGAKVLSVEKIPYKDDEYGQVQAELLLKGKTMYVYADHYNKDTDAKKAFYDKLVEIKDSNGTKTLDMTGVLNNYRKAWVGSGGLGEDETLTGTPALYLTDVDDVLVSDKAYVEVDSLEIGYNNEDLFVGGTVQLTAKLNGTLAGTAVTWKSSDETIATVSDTGLVTGLKEGKVTITLTSNVDAKYTASLELECKVKSGQPEYEVASVAEILEDDKGKLTQAYVVRGKVKGFGSKADSLSDSVAAAGDYGNLYIEDENDPTKFVQVYGLNGDFRGLTFDQASATYSFKNQKDFLTNANTKKIKKGDTISIVAVKDIYNNNLELMGVLASVNDERNESITATIKEVKDSAPLGDNSGNTSGQFVFQVTATIKGWGTSGKDEAPGEYGNMVVTDGTDDLVVYGCTASTSLSYNYNGNGKYSMANPKDFLTNDVTKELKIGDEITFDCVRADFKGSLQVYADKAFKGAPVEPEPEPEPTVPTTNTVIEHTFAEGELKQEGGNGTLQENVTFSYPESTYIGWDNNQSAKGIQIGKGSDAQTTPYAFTLSLPTGSVVKGYSVNLSCASSGVSTYTVNCGEYSKQGNLTTTATDYYDYSLNETTDTFTLTLQAEAKAMYIKSFALYVDLPVA